MAKYRPSTLDDFDVARRARDEQRRAVDASAMPTGSNVYATTEKVQNLDLGDLVTRVGDLETGKQDKLTAGANVQISSNVISATDTTYSDATQSTAGLMSTTDKIKLDGIEAGAEVNDVSSVNGQTGAVVIGDATTSASGLMSATDKTKLNGVVDDVLPVGTMLIMKTNNAPSITGTWTLVTGFHLPMTTNSSTTYYLFERTA